MIVLPWSDSFFLNLRSKN